MLNIIQHRLCKIRAEKHTFERKLSPNLIENIPVYVPLCPECPQCEPYSEEACIMAILSYGFQRLAVQVCTISLRLQSNSNLKVNKK